jgi:putative acetyltransferase
MPPIAIEAATAPNQHVRALIAGLEDELAQHYTPEQRHGLPLAALFQPHIRFFIARLDGEPVGCGGIALFDNFAEVKRMFVRPALRGRGIAQTLLRHLEAQARSAGLACLRLETGIHQPEAIRLYEKAGFRPCPAFGDYLALPADSIATSLFYEKYLAHLIP